MTDPRLQNMAKILVEYSTQLRKDDWVVLLAEPHGIPLAREFTRQATLAGAHVSLLLNDRTFDEIVLKYGSEEQAQWVTPVKMELCYSRIIGRLRAIGIEGERQSRYSVKPR